MGSTYAWQFNDLFFRKFRQFRHLLFLLQPVTAESAVDLDKVDDTNVDEENEDDIEELVGGANVFWFMRLFSFDFSEILLF